MFSLPKFTADENLDQILLDKRTPFVLVEGPFDQVIYEESCHLLTKSRDDISPKEIVFGGGKKNITNFILENSPNNVICLFDRDFDNGSYPINDSYYVELNRYSIENYFFDVKVISHLLSKLLSVSNLVIESKLNLNDIYNEWENKTRSLLAVLFFYQKKYDGEKSSWDIEFICESESYELCSHKISLLCEKLLSEMDVSQSDCIIEFNKHDLSNECISNLFPGKLLLESYFRYLRQLCNSYKRKSFSPVSSSKSLISQLAPRLIYSDDFESILLTVLK